MVRKTKEEADATRKLLLKAAVAVFSRQSYDATRLEDIAAEANVTRGAIYHHFGSKQDLYATMIGEYSKPLYDLMGSSIEPGKSFLENLRNLCINLFSALEDDADLRAIQDITVRTPPELNESIGLKLDYLEAQIMTLVVGFSEAIASGEIRAEIAPDDALRGYFGYINGIYLMWRLESEAFSLKERAPILIDLYIKGLAAK